MTKKRRLAPHKRRILKDLIRKHGMPVRAYLDVQRWTGWFPYLIARVSALPHVFKRTREIGSHVDLAFLHEDGSAWYWEARWFDEEDFAGPLSDDIRLAKLFNHSGRWLRRYPLNSFWLPVTAVESEAMSKVGVWEYDMGQNVKIWLKHRLGLHFEPDTNAHRVNCVEAAAKLIHPFMPSGWLSDLGVMFDTATPYDMQRAMHSLGVDPICINSTEVQVWYNEVAEVKGLKK